MATQIVMPRLGDFMTEGTVVRLAKTQGDDVSQGEVIAEIETEKLNYDLESVAAGVFHPVVPEGATVAVDGLIGYVLAEGEAVPEPEAPAAAPSAARAPGRAPARRQARRGSGDAPRSTPGARRLAASLEVDLSQVAPTGPGGRIVEADVRAHSESLAAAPAVVPSTPGARRLAASLEVDLSQVEATGPRGRVVESDVRAFAESRATEQAPAMPPGLPEPSRSEPLAGMRRGIASHMSDSLRNTAQLSYFLEVDVTEAQRLRREKSADGDGTLTIADVIIKACAQALARVPAMNSVLANGVIHYFDQVNIGVAVALDDGLIVPVLRDVGSMDIHRYIGGDPRTGGEGAGERAVAGRRSGRDVHHKRAWGGGRVHAHPQLSAERHTRSGQERSEARRGSGRGRHTGDDDAEPDRRPPGDRRSGGRRVHAKAASNARETGGAVQVEDCCEVE